MVPQGLGNYTVHNGFANLTTSGDNTLVAGQAGLRIAVISFRVIASDSVSVYFKSSTAGAISSTATIGPGGFGAALNPLGHFETVAGESLILNLSASVNLGVDFQYVLY